MKSWFERLRREQIHRPRLNQLVPLLQSCTIGMVA